MRPEQVLRQAYRLKDLHAKKTLRSLRLYEQKKRYKGTKSVRKKDAHANHLPKQGRNKFY